MPLTGFEGAAGTGKTHALLAEIRQRLIRQPLRPYQRVLALTFMNGSRRRLQESFGLHPDTRAIAVCLTIDSFAGNLIQRWRSIVGPIPNDFEAICEACANLLERPEVGAWIAATFPVVAVDEAQELATSRLRIVQALANHTDMFAAADEFQCLDDDHDTAPFMAWFAAGDITTLDHVRRTNRGGLLDAGVALRNGQPPMAGAGLSIRSEFPGQMPFSIGHVLQGAQGSTAVIVGPGAKPWANSMIPRWVAGMQSPRQRVRPLRVAWTASPEDEAQVVGNQVCGEGGSEVDEIERGLRAIERPPRWVVAALSSLAHCRRAQGRTRWTRDDLIAMFERRAGQLRAYGHVDKRGISVMSIHGAKNQQFRNVVLLWPHGVRASDDGKRRLLYNAITRAEYQCTVFLRAEALRNEVPFA